MNLFVSISIIVGTFSMSTISAFLICYFNNYPFMNPELTKEEKESRLNEHIRNVPMLLFQSTTFMYVVSDNIIPYGQHTWLESCYSIASYCFLIEAVYYVYHRFIHKYYYAEIHKKHHKNIIVYPIDTFFLTEMDDLASIISIGLPVIFIRITAMEQVFILYMYITSSYLSHSNLYWCHHNIHHRFMKYNYCILFPIFDILFGTYNNTLLLSE